MSSGQALALGLLGLAALSAAGCAPNNEETALQGSLKSSGSTKSSPYDQATSSEAAYRVSGSPTTGVTPGPAGKPK